MCRSGTRNLSNSFNEVKFDSINPSYKKADVFIVEEKLKKEGSQHTVYW